MRRMRHLKPREIQGCQLALDASIPTSLYDATSGGSVVAADGAVARWEDQSGNSRNVTQGTGASKPTLRIAGMNSRQSVEFDGGDRMELASIDVLSFFGSGTANTVVAVLIQDAATINNAVIGIGSSIRMGVFATFSDVIYYDAGSTSNPAGRTSVAQPSGWNDNPHVLCCTRNGASGYIRSDNATLVTNSSFSTTVTTSSQTMYVGASGAGTENHDGDISEVNVWSVGMNPSVLNRFGHSRQMKWRING